MKFLVKSLTVALVVLMLNCSKSSPTPNPLVGSWTKTKTIYSDCKYANTLLYACPATANNPLTCDQVTFNSDGTFKTVSTYVDKVNIYYYITELQGTYSVNESQFAEIFPDKTIDFTFTLSADKKTLTTISKSSTTGCTVTDIYSK